MPYKNTKHIIHVDSVKTTVIQTIAPPKDTTKTQSLFQNHLLETKNSSPEIHYTKYDYWVAGILFLSFILFTWLYVSNRKRLNQIIKGFFIPRFTNQLKREEFSFTNRVSIFLWILFVLSLTLFFSELLSFFNIPALSESTAISYLIIAFFIIVVYIIKVIAIKLLGYIFQTNKEASDYILTIYLFGNTLGLILLPIVISIAFIKQISPAIFIYTGICTIVAFMLTRIIRGFIIGYNSLRFSLFYLFLYLCALEILPFVIMVKLFLIRMN